MNDDPPPPIAHDPRTMLRDRITSALQRKLIRSCRAITARAGLGINILQNYDSDAWNPTAETITQVHVALDAIEAEEGPKALATALAQIENLTEAPARIEEIRRRFGIKAASI